MIFVTIERRMDLDRIKGGGEGKKYSFLLENRDFDWPQKAIPVTKDVL